MSIAWTEFTPGAALAGRAFIGGAAAMFVLLNGRIAGISGGLFRPVSGDLAWRATFVPGLVAAPWPRCSVFRTWAGPGARRWLGVGWGLVGFCPGPGLAALGAGEIKALVFLAVMLAGMGIFEWLEHRRRP